MTNEDQKDCLRVLDTMKKTCKVFAKYKSDDPVILAFVYGIDEAINVLVEIIEN